MKRSYSYLLSALGISAAIFGGIAIAQQKTPATAETAPPAVVAPAAATATATTDATTTAAAPVFDLASVKDMPVGLERGQKIAAGVCFSCHNADGNSTIPLQPKLAGQHEAYLIKQLHDFKKAEGATEALRGNMINDKGQTVISTMGSQAAALSDDDIKSVAMWFSSQTLQPAHAQIDDPAISELGKKIYKGGLMAKGVPACAGCHGPTGAGIMAKYPRISGQFSEYVELQLKGFREDARTNSQPMQDIAKRMTDTEIRAVADYMAGVR